MSSRNNPFDELERIFERLSREFSDASRSWNIGEPNMPWKTEESMALDLVEHDDHFIVAVDLPGFEREDVEVSVTDHMLRISANREQEIEDKDTQYIRHERQHRTEERSLALPDAVDPENVTARMKNGVLTVTLPKIEDDESRTIDIE
ncbi:Hsp20/alpha crystallin family protein [Haloferax namakaokahaiae]|uniref:Hsp20/alpha crystallin family protein n=1 Tax=Haloferax namakaokahaiae TaxID=1748331 RepID=A0ABD5ZDR6_9EURY